jgi:hypothetical protein
MLVLRFQYTRPVSDFGSAIHFSETEVVALVEDYGEKRDWQEIFVSRLTYGKLKWVCWLCILECSVHKSEIGENGHL